MQSSDWKDKHTDNAAEGLLYWVNCTNMTVGSSTSVALLVQAAKMILNKATTPENVDTSIDIIVGLFEGVRADVKSGQKDTNKKDSGPEAVDFDKSFSVMPNPKIKH